MSAANIRVADEASIAEAALRLGNGEVVAFPTETVYGLGADAASLEAVAAIYRIKGRPADHPLIVHVLDARQAAWWGEIGEAGQRLIAAFWPGPLTLIVRRRAQAPGFACGGESTVGLRSPSHPVARDLLAAFAHAGGHGVAAPSANRFGHVSPTTADHVRADLGADVDLVLDGGPCAVGLESTIVDLATDPAAPRILRTGAVTRDDVARVLGLAVTVVDAAAAGGGESGGVRAPGMLAAHYAPRAGVELVSADEAAPRAAALAAPPVRRVVLIAATSVAAPTLTPAQRIDAPDEPAAFARRLYAMLREADDRAADVALVVPPPASGLGEAVRDRLRRAAAGRAPG